MRPDGGNHGPWPPAASAVTIPHQGWFRNQREDDADDAARQPGGLPDGRDPAAADGAVDDLWVLCSDGPTRFGALKRRVPGISGKMLTERLRMLEQAGIIFRRYTPTIPPQVTYGLTARGEELRAVLDDLNAVARRWQEEDRATAA